MLSALSRAVAARLWSCRDAQPCLGLSWPQLGDGMGHMGGGVSGRKLPTLELWSGPAPQSNAINRKRTPGVAIHIPRDQIPPRSPDHQLMRFGPTHSDHTSQLRVLEDHALGVSACRSEGG